MIIKIKETGKLMKVELKTWHNGFNAGLSPDMSQDIIGCTTEFGHIARDDNNNPIMTGNNFEDFVDWWRNEVDNANDDPYNYSGDGLSGTRYGDNPEDYKNEPEPDEYIFSVSEME